MTLGHAPLTDTGLSGSPVFVASSAPAVEVLLAGFAMTLEHGTGFSIGGGTSTEVIGLSATGELGGVVGGPAGAVVEVTLSGVSSTGDIGLPLVRAGATAMLTGFTLQGQLGSQASPVTEAVAPTVELAGLEMTLGALANPQVQAWEFGVVAANDRWVPVPPVSGTPQ